MTARVQVVLASRRAGRALALARCQVARRYAGSVNEQLILRGDWDAGALVREALDSIRAEQTVRAERRASR